MKRLNLLFALLFLYNINSPAVVLAKVPKEASIRKEIDSNVRDVKSKRAPKWVIEYSGDTTGSIHGGIMMAMSLPSFTKVTGAAMSKDMRRQAPESFVLTILTVNTPPTATMALTLPDGSKCRDEKGSKVEITDKASRTFKAEATGELICGDKKITYTAKMNKKP